MHRSLFPLALVMLLHFVLPANGEPLPLLISDDTPSVAALHARPASPPTPRRLHDKVLDPRAPGLRGRALRIAVSPDRELPAVVADHERSTAGRARLTARAGDSPDINFSLAVVDGAVAGAMHLLGEGVYELSGSIDDVVVTPVDPSVLPPCGGALPSPGPMSAELSMMAASDFTISSSGVTTVDVAVVYTTAARMGAGGTAQVQAAVENAILQANTVFANSQIDAVYRLVYTGETPYTETGDMVVELNRLTDQGDGHLDEVHCLRDRYGADLVGLVLETGQYGGLAWILCNPNFPDPGRAFSVVRRDLLAHYLLAHEFGHNFGCDHDRQNPSSCRAHTYSYGYRFTNDTFLNKTVMAYDPGFTIGHFSNPNVSFFGSPTGVAPPSPQSAYNALTIQNTLPIIAQYRPSIANPQPLPPPMPSGVSAIAIQTNALRVSWQAACESTGYIVRRDGTPIAQVTGLSYDDANLQTGVSYCYTVIATNAVGASPISAAACQITPFTPPFVMDGVADHPGYLLASPGMTLYAAVRTNQLYVATWSSGIYPGDTSRNDHFVFVSDTLLPSATAPAPWAKAGQIAVPSNRPYLAAESQSDYIAWFNVSGASAATKHPENSGQMEGYFDFISTFGQIPPVVYLASAAYNTLDGGALVAQAPAGSGPNIDPHEFLAMPISALLDRDGDGLFDRLDPRFDFVIHETERLPGNQIRVRWASVPGRAYRVDRAPAPGAGWAEVHAATGAAAVDQTEWIDPAPPASTAVYRVRYLP